MMDCTICASVSSLGRSCSASPRSRSRPTRRSPFGPSIEGRSERRAGARSGLESQPRIMSEWYPASGSAGSFWPKKARCVGNAPTGTGLGQSGFGLGRNSSELPRRALYEGGAQPLTEDERVWGVELVVAGKHGGRYFGRGYWPGALETNGIGWSETSRRLRRRFVGLRLSWTRRWRRTDAAGLKGGARRAFVHGRRGMVVDFPSPPGHGAKGGRPSDMAALQRRHESRKDTEP